MPARLGNRHAHSSRARRPDAHYQLGAGGSPSRYVGSRGNIGIRPDTRRKREGHLQSQPSARAIAGHDGSAVRMHAGARDRQTEPRTLGLAVTWRLNADADFGDRFGRNPLLAVRASLSLEAETDA